MTWRLQNVARRVVFKAHLTGTDTPATGKTIAVQISKDGGGFANPNAGATNATEIASGWYYVALAAADYDTLGELVVRGTEGTIDPAERVYEVVAATNAGLTRLDADVSSRVATAALPANFSALAITVGGLIEQTQGSADKAWASAARTLTAFSTALAVSVWDVLEAAIATVNSIGVKLKTNVDAATSTRAAPADVPTAAQNADGLLGRNIAGGANGGRTVTSALRFLRNRKAIAAGTLTVYEEDDATSAWTAAVTTAVGNPISEVDPA